MVIASNVSLPIYSHRMLTGHAIQAQVARVGCPPEGFVNGGRHHETFLSNPGLVDPSRLRTILRQSVVPAYGVLFGSSGESHSTTPERQWVICWS